MTQAAPGRISAVLNTYNASEHLAEVLDALKDFDEIVVCDMESTDDTLEIARAHGARTVTFPRGSHTICEPARNTAIRAASSEWVLVVDADEIVTPELRDYLYRQVKSPQGAAYDIPRLNMLLGRYMHQSPDRQLRFFRRDAVDWPPIIHAKPAVDGKIVRVPAKLKGVHLLHLDDAPISSRITKLNVYTDREVSKRTGKAYGTMKMLLRPAWFFLRSYLFQGGFRDGRRGIVNAYLKAMYQMALLAKVTEERLKGND